MRYLYFYKRSFFKRNTLTYTIDKHFIPEKFECFLIFLEAANLIVDAEITPKEYLAAIVNYRKQNLSHTDRLTEASMFDQKALEALEVYLFNKKEFSGPYILPGLEDVKDPQEELVQFKQDQQYIWDAIRSSSHNDEEALKKIFSTNLRDSFDEAFFSDVPAFQRMVEAKQLQKASDGFWHLVMECPKT